MKKIIVLLASSLIVGSVLADIAVELKNNAGIVYEPGGVTFVNQALVQLIWTADPTGKAGVGGALASGEYLLNSLVTTSGAWGTWGDQPQGVLQYDDGDVGGTAGQDTVILGGYFFVRIFDNSKTDLNDYYLQQSQEGPSLDKYVSTVPATIYDTNGLLGGALDAQNNQVIPEPAVAALIGIFGGGMLVGRRLFSKTA
jgi:hypothetical protein